MNTLIAIAALVAGAAPSGMEGDWRGTGKYDRFTMRLSGDLLEMRVGTDASLEPRKSHYTVNADYRTIDIHRDDGLQLGRYKIYGDKLILILADVGSPRAKPLTETFAIRQRLDRLEGKRPTQTEFVFERVKP